MMFNGADFLIYLAALIVVFAVTPGRTGRKLVLIAAGLVFYASWDAAFLPGLLVYALLGWGAGRVIDALEEERRRAAAGVTVALAFVAALGWFKYRRFVSLQLAALGLGSGVEAPLAPLGISFFTFEIVSYVIDVRRRDTRPFRTLLDFCAFLMFFPRMIAGPIVRPADFARQLDDPRSLSLTDPFKAAELFVIGAILKGVIGDAQVGFVDAVFREPWLFTSSTALLAAIAYGIQIFGDFAGYSLMASGLARLFGFTMPWNFDAPYAARSITEFWRRWHMSLSFWLRDYLYIPLGGSRGSHAATCRNLMVTMLLGGLWHGPDWTFVLWGGAHGALLAFERIWRVRGLPALPRALSTPLALVIVLALWIPFRAPGLGGAGAMLAAIAGPGAGVTTWHSPWTLLALAVMLPAHVLYETWPGFCDLFDPTAPERRVGAAALARAMGVGAGALVAVVWTQRTENAFIYFQF